MSSIVSPGSPIINWHIVSIPVSSAISMPVSILSMVVFLLQRSRAPWLSDSMPSQTVRQPASFSAMQSSLSSDSAREAHCQLNCPIAAMPLQISIARRLLAVKLSSSFIHVFIPASVSCFNSASTFSTERTRYLRFQKCELAQKEQAKGQPREVITGTPIAPVNDSPV